MKSFPGKILREERSQTGSPAYGFIVTHGATTYHLTNFDRSITLTGLPAALGSDPETFEPAPIAWTRQSQKKETRPREVGVKIGLRASAEVTAIRDHFLEPITKAISLRILLFNSQSIHQGADLAYAADVYTEFAGRSIAVGFEDRILNLNCVSLMGERKREIPIYPYQKTCPHQLYHTSSGGFGCTVNRDATDGGDYLFRVDTTIAAIDRSVRGVTIATDFMDDGSTAIEQETFQGGIYVDGSGNEIGITAVRQVAGPAWQLLLEWLPRGTAASDSITIYRGCNRTAGVCESVFDNLDQFGGHPYIPTVNPTTNGINV